MIKDIRKSGSPQNYMTVLSCAINLKKKLELNEIMKQSNFHKSYF